MRPYREALTRDSDSSLRLLNRRLQNAIPFEWHHHREFELTLTLNSRGQRFVGDHVGDYDDGDLVLLGPNRSVRMLVALWPAATSSSADASTKGVGPDVNRRSASANRGRQRVKRGDSSRRLSGC